MLLLSNKRVVSLYAFYVIAYTSKILSKAMYSHDFNTDNSYAAINIELNIIYCMVPNSLKTCIFPHPTTPPKKRII